MRFVAALLYAVSTAVLLGCVQALSPNGLTEISAWVALTGGLAVGGMSLWQERTKRFLWPRLTIWDGAVLTVFALFALRAFLWLIYRDEDEIKVLSPNNLGDLSLHITYIRHFAAGAPFWPENPIFAGKPLTYPIGMDLFNALLVCVGVDIVRAFIWVGLIGSACAATALWKWGRAFAVAGFLFAGGLWGFDFLHRWQLLDYQSDVAWDRKIEVAWKSLPLAIFVTQRGMLFALPAGLLLLTSWRARFLDAEGSACQPDSSSSHLPLWGEVLLYATMPIFHLHTFLFLSVMAAVWFVAVPAARRHLGTVVGAAFIPATAQVWYITGGFTGASMLGWKPGWMQGNEGFFVFWFRNFGVLPLLIGALVFTIVRRRRCEAATLTYPALAVFLLCCFVKFAPWEWDNTKLMLWSYLVVLPPLWSELLVRWPEWARVLTCVALFFSGGISLFGGLGNGYSGFPIAMRSEVEGIGNVLRSIPITERFIAHPTYNHPLLLNGRVLAMGYEGHVASHGLEWAPRKRAVETILQGEPGWRETARRLGVRYLFWGRDEMENYPDSTQPWRESARSIVKAEWGEVFDLEQPALGK
jgi:hypothetical protein